MLKAMFPHLCKRDFLYHVFQSTVTFTGSFCIQKIAILIILGFVNRKFQKVLLKLALHHSQAHIFSNAAVFFLLTQY